MSLPREGLPLGAKGTSMWGKWVLPKKGSLVQQKEFFGRENGRSLGSGSLREW